MRNPAIWTVFILLLAGCEFSVDPLQENDQYHFSMYGYLDASADTQWVRVMPIRDSLFYEPKPLDATVTLTNSASGETVDMNDSLFSYVQGVYTHNFWTTVDIEPAETYRITAESTEGKEASSNVEVTLPEDFPTPLVVMARDRQSDKPDRIYINGLEKVADVQTVYHVAANSGGSTLYTVPHLKDTSRTTSGGYVAVIDREEEQQKVNNFIANPVLKKQIFVAAGGPDYPKLARIEQSVVVLPEGISNVENGVGFVGGIVSKTVPYKGCFKEGTDVFVHCPLEPPPW
jgi:hypothetical protein